MHNPGDYTRDELYEILEFLASEAEKPFSGWDFSYISDSRRMAEAPLSWNYASKLLPYLRRANSLLDLGTGGGEVLSRLQPLPQESCATEAYPPNVPIARQRLEPLGVTVYETSDDGILPFRDNQFELVIDRHESFSCKELGRILKAGGHFITQQVGDTGDIRDTLGCDEPAESLWNLQETLSELRRHSFEILEEKEEFYNTRFYDVGALAYYLTAIPWVVPDFSLERYQEPLIRLHERIQRDGYVDFRSHAAFLISQRV